MNNLFRITKNNVDDFFIEYQKNKNNKNENNKTENNKNNKTKKNLNEKKSYKILKTYNDKVNTNEIIISRNNLNFKNKINKEILNHTKPLEVNFNYEKNNKTNDTTINNNFNCEIKKNVYETQIIGSKKNFNFNNSNNNKNNKNENLKSKENIKSLSNKNKIILEFGKSSIKLDRLKKSMKHNFNIFSLINQIIISFINFNPKLKLNNLFKIYNEKNQNKENINKIHWNSKGEIIIESNSFLNVIINDKIKNTDEKYNLKKYNLIDFGYIKLYGITFTEEFINKNKIPSLDSIIKFSDNIRHFLKLIKLLSYTNKYKIKINQLGNYNFYDVIYKNLPSIILNINEKKNLFDSTDKKYTFYLKILETKTISFIIDKEEKIIFYINSIEKNTSGYIFFYVMALDSKYKIIDYNKNIV